MTREQVINYLKSTGFSEEQIKTVINALTCEDCISRQALLDKIEKPMNWTDSEAALQEQRDYDGFIELVKSMPSVTPKEREENKMVSTNTIKNMIVKPRAKAIEIITEVIESMRCESRKSVTISKAVGIVAIKAVTGVTEENSFIDMVNFYNDMPAITVATYIYNYAEKVSGKVGETCQN